MPYLSSSFSVVFFDDVGTLSYLIGRYVPTQKDATELMGGTEIRKFRVRLFPRRVGLAHIPARAMSSQLG